MPSRRMSALRIIAMLLALTLLSTACSGGEDAEDDATDASSAATESGDEAMDEEDTDEADSSSGGEGSFVVGLPAFFVEDFAPGDTGASYVEYSLWTPLTQVDENGELQMMVAESIESDDQQNWTITLEDGWTFHDGSPITAQSFVDAWNAVADPENAFANNGIYALFEGYDAMNPTDGEEPTADTLSGLTVVDDLTIEATLAEANALFPNILAGTAFAPLPEGVDDFEAFGTNPIGNGPFMMQEGGFEPGDQSVTLERYDDYAGTVAAAESVELRTYQDPSPIYTDFQAGAIDIALLDGADLADASTAFEGQIVEVPFPAAIYLAFPLADERFADPDVRRAISQAIDRESIVESLAGGFGTASTGLAAAEMIGADPGSCDACEYDPEGAAALLEEAGGWEGEFTLYTYQEATNERVLEGIANQMRSNLGIEEVSFEAQEIGQLYDSLFAEAIDGPTLLYAGAAYPHLYGLASTTLLPGADLNVSGYDSEEFAGLMSGAASAEDADGVVSQTQDAVGLALEDLPITPIFHPVGGLVHSENLSGVVAEPLGGPKLAAVSVE